MRTTKAFAISATLLCIAIQYSTASAEGALAVGVPQDVVKGGFSYGWTANKATSEEARSGALAACRKNDGAPDDLPAKKLCKFVDDFRNKCVSIAMDPKAGTPGVGWAIATIKADAVRQAIVNCRATSSASRSEYCETADTACDGDAK